MASLTDSCGLRYADPSVCRTEVNSILIRLIRLFRYLARRSRMRAEWEKSNEPMPRESFGIGSIQIFRLVLTVFQVPLSVEQRLRPCA